MAAEFFYHWPRADAVYEVTRLPRHFNDVAKGKVRTFGAALSRAHELELAEVLVIAVPLSPAVCGKTPGWRVAARASKEARSTRDN